MKLSIFTSLNSVVMTTMVMIALHISNTHHFVDAQLQVDDCTVYNTTLYTDYGNSTSFTQTPIQYETCRYNISAPYTVTLANGSSVNFGSVSSVHTLCESRVTRSLETCSCSVIVNASDPETDPCNSCTIQSISDTELVSYFDCSNVLVGDCVGIDAAGLCINNTGEVTSAPISKPVATSAPLGIGSGSPTSAPTMIWYDNACFSFNNSVVNSLFCKEKAPISFAYESFDGSSSSCLNEPCTCAVSIDVYPFETLNECNSCSFQQISDTEIRPYYDCSNLLDGYCVGIDAAGQCTDDAGRDTLAPVRSPISITSSATVGAETVLISIGFAIMMITLFG